MKFHLSVLLANGIYIVLNYTRLWFNILAYLAARPSRLPAGHTALLAHVTLITGTGLEPSRGLIS